jgi:hypothetical protein
MSQCIQAYGTSFFSDPDPQRSLQTLYPLSELTNISNNKHTLQTSLYIASIEDTALHHFMKRLGASI